MPGFLSDEAAPLDGTVGTLDAPGAPARFSSPDESPLRVFVSGDATSDPGVMGLAEDVGLLIREFLSARASVARQSPPPAPPEPRADLAIALHGLHLGPDEDARLQQLIRELVDARMGRKDADA